MLQVHLTRPGPPSEAVELVEVNDSGPPPPGHIVVQVLAFPINPADLLTVSGNYPRTDSTNPVIGSEAVGIVQQIAEDVTHIRVGDRAMILDRDNWSEQRTVPAERVIVLRADIDPIRLATLKVNPATAQMMLHRYTTLAAGDWIIQNAANSSVGRLVVQLAARQGIHTYNIVRSLDQRAGLETLGATIIATHNEPYPAHLPAPHLGLDAVGGASTGNMTAALAPGSTVITYGALSGQPFTVDPTDLVFRDIRYRGFWLTRELAGPVTAQTRTMYQELEDLINRGELHDQVDSVHHLTDIKAALARAQSPDRSGKVIVSLTR